MSDSEMFVQSLRNRIRAMNTIWERAIGDMTLEQVNHHERDGVLPIAFSFGHFMRAQDQSISAPFLQEPLLWVSGGWAEKIGRRRPRRRRVGARRGARLADGA